MNWLFWSPFLLGSFSTLGAIFIIILYSWHVTALRNKKYQNLVIDAEFYEVD